MGQPITAGKLRAAGRIAGVAAMLALLLFLGAAAVSPTLHEAICPDAGEPTDACAVVNFAAGLVEASPVLILCLAVVLGVFVPLSWRSEFHHAAPLFRLSPSRAPPV